ncbi:MAG: RnfABCDGE type electron transport complex subunit D [Ruminococcus sp.]|nr:RnfABCDGE type electron transport complex subunit D [Ruminococcus sp.]
MLKKIKSERMVWMDVMLTLLVLELMSYFYYGVRALWIGGICIAVSLAAEFITLRIRSRRFTADDLSCTSDALIIALMMPAAIDIKIPAIACVFAVVAAKNVFGGRKNMIFSPAAAAYLLILTSWENDLLSYPAVYDKLGIFEQADDLSSSASFIFNTTGSIDSTDYEILLGSFAGPMGTGSILLLIIIAVILILRRNISAGAFIGTISGTAFMAYICPIVDNAADSVKYVLSTNMILFAAIYIISDRRIAPAKNYYAFFYGLFIALFSYVVMLTTGKENVIVIASVLFTPLALAFKNLEKKIASEKENEILESEYSDSPEENKTTSSEDSEEGAESNE